MQTSEPPLILGRIHGMRHWLVNERTQRLSGVVRRVPWPAGRPITARCRRAPRKAEHVAPVQECGCGIYAYHPGRLIAERLRHMSRASPAHGRRRPLVLGLVEAWGRTEVHADGFRAQYARPVCLIAFEDAQAEERERIDAIAARYAVDVWSVPDPGALWKRCVAAEMGGLGEDTREDLLACCQEIVLAPGVRARRIGDTPLGGEGYEPLDDLDQDFGPRRIGGRCGYAGSLIVRIVGAFVRPAALQDAAVVPGSPLKLVPERNLHDPDAVAVWDEHMRTQLGYVPRSHARRVGVLLRSERIVDVRAIWQWRDLRSGARTELWMLIARSPVRLAREEELKVDDSEIPF